MLIIQERTFYETDISKLMVDNHVRQDAVIKIGSSEECVGSRKENSHRGWTRITRINGRKTEMILYLKECLFLVSRSLRALNYWLFSIIFSLSVPIATLRSSLRYEARAVFTCLGVARRAKTDPWLK